MKKVLAIIPAIALVATLGVASVYAQSNGTTQRETMVTKLAEKLGISEEKVETAMTEAREEVHEEMVAQREEAISEAVEEGKLTEDQEAILNAMEEIREEKFDSSQPRQGGFKGEMVELLNEKGLDVTEEELQELREVTQELGIVGEKGAGKGMGMHRGM